MKTTRKSLRLAALLLALILVIPSLLTACGENKKESATPESGESSVATQTTPETQGGNKTQTQEVLLSAYEKTVALTSGTLQLTKYTTEQLGKASDTYKRVTKMSFATDKDGKTVWLGVSGDRFGDDYVEIYYNDLKTYEHYLEDNTYECTENYEEMTPALLFEQVISKSGIFETEYSVFVEALKGVELSVKSVSGGTQYSYEAPIAEFAKILNSQADMYMQIVDLMEEYKEYDCKGTLTFTVDENGILVGFAGKVSAQGEFVDFATGTEFILTDPNADVNVTAPAWISKATVKMGPGGSFEMRDDWVLNAGAEYDIYDYIEIYNYTKATFLSDGNLTFTKDGKFAIPATAAHGSKIEVTVMLENSFGTKELTEILYVNAKAPTIETVRTDFSINEIVRIDDFVTVSCADTVTYQVADESIFEINSYGLLRGKKEGSVKVTVCAANSFGSTEKEITVKIFSEKPYIIEGYYDEYTVGVGFVTRCFAGVYFADSYEVKVSDESVLKVDRHGYALGLKKGSATVTVTAKSAAGETTYTVQIEVKEAKPTITSYLDEDAELILSANTAESLYYYLDFINAQSVSYASSDTKVATVSEHGMVRGIAKGSAKITVTAKNEFGTESLELTVTVTENPPVLMLYGPEIFVDGSSEYYDVRDCIYADNYQQITYKSSDESVLSVTADGELIAHKDGTANVTVTATNEFGSATATVTVTVKFEEPFITDYYWKLELNLGTSEYIYNYFNASYATDVTFESSNEKVVTVNKRGDLEAVGEGTATITVTVSNPAGTDSCTITVNVAARKPVIELYYDDLKLWVGATDYLSAYIEYCNDENSTITYESSDMSIVEVNEYRELTALKEGSVTITITATNANGSTSATVTVTVEELYPEITVLFDERTIEEGWYSLDNFIEVYYYEELTVTSSDESIVEIDEDNWLFATGQGTVTVTVTATNPLGSVTKSFILTVSDEQGDENKEPPSFIIENGDDFVMNQYEWFILPDYVYDYDSLTIKISDTSIVWADTDDWLYTESIGTVTVTVTAQNEFGSVTVTFTIEVINASNEEYEGLPYFSIEDDVGYYDEVLYMPTGLRYFIEMYVHDYDTYEVESSDLSVVAIINEGYWGYSMYGVSEGQAQVTFTATNANGTATITFNVEVYFHDWEEDDVEDVNKRPPTIDIPDGDVAYAEIGDVAYFPYLVENYDSLTVTSTDESVAVVNPDQTLTCVGLGTAVITITATNEYGTSTVTVTVIVE